MQLYTTSTSPFGYITRIVILEKGLADRIEVIEAKTRVIQSAYYNINPSGRVPYLMLDNGTGLEETQLICAYLDHIDNQPQFDHPTGENGWESKRLEALARSMLDGISVWSRELHRPHNEQSPTIIAHEVARAQRLVNTWETEIQHPLMNGPLNMAQITLATALNTEYQIDGFDFRGTHIGLTAWADKLSARPSFQKILTKLAG